jgi:hypothetical protein
MASVLILDVTRPLAKVEKFAAKDSVATIHAITKPASLVNFVLLVRTPVRKFVRPVLQVRFAKMVLVQAILAKTSPAMLASVASMVVV